jgi:hypothetical protein
MSWLPWVRWRRKRLRETPLDPAQAIHVDTVAESYRLSDDERRTLTELVQIFLDEKTFEGCGGLVLTEEIRVSIAAQACLLLVGLDPDAPFPGLDVLRIYPHGYHAHATGPLGDLRVPLDSHRLGESGRGYIVLSWRAVEQGLADPHDGHNVVLHELAHQLDTEDGAADGAPVLPRALYGPWARVLGASYAELAEDIARGRPTVLDSYGATDPAEFFAVATESFFEEPVRLRDDDRALYDMLRTYYRQDPADR